MCARVYVHAWFLDISMHIFESVCVCVCVCVCDYMQPLNLTRMYMDVCVNITQTFQLMHTHKQPF